MRPPRSLAAVLALALIARVAAVAANGTARRLVVTFPRGDTKLASEACASLNRAPHLVSPAGETTKAAACLHSARGACLRAFAAKGGLVDGFAGTLDREALACLDADAVFAEEDAEVKVPERFSPSPRVAGEGRVSRPRHLERRGLLERDARSTAPRADLNRAATNAWLSGDDDDAPGAKTGDRVSSKKKSAGAAGGFSSAATTLFSWPLDRLDQVSLPLDGARVRPGGGGVRVFVLDTGIRASHVEFARPGSRGGSNLGAGVDVLAENETNEDATEGDRDGHGTHVAALVAGATTGAAPLATLHSVRVLGRDGGGRVSDVLAGLEWTRAFLETKGSPQTRAPSVLVLALGTKPGVASETLERAVERLVETHGVFVVAAGGNDPSRSSCATSPARSRRVFAVGASDEADAAYAHGSGGACLDAFAPGVRARSAFVGSGDDGDDDVTYAVLSGSSMAAGVAAGVAAHFLGRHPDASPEETRAALAKAASAGKVRTFPRGGTRGTPEDASLLRIPPVWARVS